MNAMIDAQCRCGRRFGWCGSPANRPACPWCGHRPPQAELDRAEAEMRRFRELLATSPHRATGEQRREQRIAAGLTLRNAASLLNIPAVILSASEQGMCEVSAALAAAMVEVYGLDAQ